MTPLPSVIGKHAKGSDCILPSTLGPFSPSIPPSLVHFLCFSPQFLVQSFQGEEAVGDASSGETVTAYPLDDAAVFGHRKHAKGAQRELRPTSTRLVAAKQTIDHGGHLHHATVLAHVCEPPGRVGEERPTRQRRERPQNSRQI